MMEIDEKIDNLNPGEQLNISSYNGISVHVERSGDGKHLRFVRTFADGSFSVFKKCSF